MKDKHLNRQASLSQACIKPKYISAFGLSGLLFLLAACGGGGGGSAGEGGAQSKADTSLVSAGNPVQTNTGGSTSSGGSTPSQGSTQPRPTTPYTPPPAVTPQQETPPPTNPAPPPPTTPLPTNEPPSVVGQWSPVYAWPQVAINLNLLPDGRLLSWADDDDADYHRTGARGSGKSKAFVVPIPTDGVPGTPINVFNDTTNLFCSGQSFLPDGRLLVAGGHLRFDGDGAPDTNIFDYRTLGWQKVESMNAGRWYPTVTSLANGEMLVIGGLRDPNTINDLPQVWKVGGGWRDLTGAKVSNLAGYAPMHLAPNGQVFVSNSNMTKYLDTANTGKWTDVAWHNYNGQRDYGTSVVYDDGKVLTMGGGDPPTATAEIIDLNAAEPRWQWTGTMRYARRQLNATIMADGKILVTGGTTSPGFNDAAGAVLAAESWDPANGRWTTLASMKVPRLYHSTALLLPDGRILSAGGGRPAPVNGVDNENVEIFSPPYLFNGPRPQLTRAPESIGYGQSFVAETPDKADIQKVTFIRLSAVTHSFNMNQRINYLAFNQAANGISITGPSDPRLTPPGHYMLFLINSKGVPSVAKIMQIQ